MEGRPVSAASTAPVDGSKKPCVYVLKLEGGFFYIGRTNDFNRRCQEHLNGTGSEWTNLHKPLISQPYGDLVECNPFEEERLVKEYMLRFGIDNVRGGPYSQVILSDKQIEELTISMRNETNSCLKCGSSNHYIKNCDFRDEKKVEVARPSESDDLQKVVEPIISKLIDQKFDQLLSGGAHGKISWEMTEDGKHYRVRDFPFAAKDNLKASVNAQWNSGGKFWLVQSSDFIMLMMAIYSATSGNQ